MKHKLLDNFHLSKSLPFADLYVNEDHNTVVMKYRENTIVDIQVGKLMADAVYPLIQKGVVLGMTDATAKNIQVTTEARRFLGNNKSMNATIAHAIVLKELHLRIIANLFIKFDNPTVPVKIFNNLKKAEKFLQNQLLYSTSEVV